MSNHNNLRPRNLPIWPTAIFLIGLVAAAIIIRERFQLRAGWFVFVMYIVVFFLVVVVSFRPAWGRSAFWLTAGILLVLHALAGLLLVLLFPAWLDILGSFLTVIVVSDLLLTLLVLWPVTSAQRPDAPSSRPDSGP